MVMPAAVCPSLTGVGGERDQIFQGERMPAAILDLLTHHSHIFDMNGESYRFRESMNKRKGRKAE
ncbi:hypothetical protein GC170_16460 [bacterium]|nr:hypothetical protein [bacterium]